MPHRNLGGRPPKYREPSRPVTITLPENTLRQLEMISPDRGQAIVKLSSHLARNQADSPNVEIIEVGQNSGLIIVGPCQDLTKIPFLHLIEVAPARFLLAIDNEQDFGTLELAIQDLLDSEKALSERDQETIVDLLATIRQLRRDQRTSQAEILLVNL